MTSTDQPIDLVALTALLAAYPTRGAWFLDQDPDGDEDGFYGYVDSDRFCAPSTHAEIEAGADEVHEIGEAYPIAAARLVVGAVNALPALLAEVQRLRQLQAAVVEWRWSYSGSRQADDQVLANAVDVLMGETQ